MSPHADASHPLAAADALLIDLDGTLVDSSGSVRRAWTAFAIRNGLDPEAVHLAAQGRPSRESVRALAPDADHVRETALVDRDEETDVDGIVALPGAAALLDAAERPMAIVTSCSRALATVRLRAAGLTAPAVVVTANDITRGKPDPEGFLLGARRLGIAPERCVVLEDAPAGIAAGRAAGARVVALRSPTHPDAALAEADWIADDIAALLAGDVAAQHAPGGPGAPTSRPS